MSLAYNLVNSLAETESNEDLTTLVIDHYTRTIQIPKGITTLGVESDDEVLRLKFKMPRYLGTVDLYNFSIRINYINAQGEDDVYKVTDKAIVGANITFSWLVGPTATAYKGNTKFNVCMVITDANSVIQKEYNTAPASLPVKEGMECSERVVSEYTDILEQWERRLFGIGDTEEANLVAVSEQEQAVIANKGAEVLATIPAEYTATFKMAEESVRTKADAIICSAEGETIAVSDSSDDNIRGLKIFGKTTQVKTTGKNLLPQTCITQTVSGVTFTVNADGSITANGTSTGVFSYAINAKLKGLQSGETYTITGNPYKSTNYMLYFDQKDSNGTNLGSCQDYGNGATATLSENYEYMWVGIFSQAGVTFNNVTFYPMVRLASIVDDSYEPYTGGIASPSPDWPQELVSIENPTVEVYGKNLLNITATTQTSNGITFTINDDKTAVINGTATADAYCGLTQSGILPRGKYILSGCTNGSSNTYFLYTDTGAIYNRDSEVEFTIDTPSEKKFLIKVHSGVTVNNTVVKPMLRLAEVDDSTYEAPSEYQQLSLPRSLPGIPVTSGGNYTDANGQQWICDEIDFERGVYVQRIKVTTVSISSQGVLDNGLQAGIYKARDKVPQLSVGAICDRAKYVGMSGSAKKPGCVYENVNTFGFTGTETSTLEMLQAAYDGATIAYILATPIETPLTADELAAFQALKTNYPNTTVMNDAGAWMEMTYNADTETWINNLIDEKIAAAVAKLN